MAESGTHGLTPFRVTAKLQCHSSIVVKSRRHRIVFNLPGNGPWTITTATLWVITPVVIDGTTQPGYDGAFNRVYVEGGPGVSSVFFLTNHSGTTIKGLGIYNYWTEWNAPTDVMACWKFGESRQKIVSSVSPAPTVSRHRRAATSQVIRGRRVRMMPLGV